MATQKMQLVDWLDDLCVRFIINLPQEELESVARICFQVEEAQWFYEDFVRPIDPTLPSLNLKQFCLKIFQHCPLLSAFSDEQHLAAYQDFLGYKTRVPVRGAIMLNYEMDKVVLVKGWKNNASWSFPRGKINKDEKDLDCAIREVYEETGFDIHIAGLAPEPDEVKAIDVTMREQHMRLFVFRGVPEDTMFEPKTRKEISKIQWYRLADLPTLKKSKQTAQSDGHESYNPSKFYMVAPFLGPLKKWIHKQKKIDAQQALYEEGLEGDELPSEAYVEEQPAPLPETSATAADLHDPASELKRLLSVKSAQQAPQYVEQLPSPSNQEQASSLLAMLRAAPTPAASIQQYPQAGPPRTPLEQMGGRATQPDSPHVHHVRESPYATSQPPPQFSPQHAQTQPMRFDTHAASGQAMYNAIANHQHRGLTNNQQSLLQMMQLRPQAEQTQTNPHQDFHQQLPVRVAAPQHSMPQTTIPQSHHSLANPSRPQPPPGLNSHAMGLLSAFKAGPESGHNTALLDTLRQNPPPRNIHQNSLLDLFKSPGVAPAVQASTSAVSDGLGPGNAAAHSPPLHDATPKPPAKTARRPSAMSMINRTLPKAKAQERKPSAPSMDNDNFPTLGSAPPPVQKPPRESIEAAKPIASSSPKQMKILARPEQSAVSAQSASRPTSGGRLPVSQPTKTILQRPPSSSRGHAIPPAAAAAVVEPAAAPGSSQSNKPAFQPQILKRGEVVDSQAVPSTLPDPAHDPSVEQAKQTHNQRDTLLSLFARSQPQTRGMSPPAAITTPPLASSAQFRSSVGDMAGTTGRVSRHASIASTGVQHDGMRSPGTPSEKRGFLMDYLDGVVRGAK